MRAIAGMARSYSVSPESVRRMAWSAAYEDQTLRLTGSPPG